MTNSQKDARYAPIRIFSASEDPQSRQSTVRITAVEYQREIPPTFTDPDNKSVNIFGIWENGKEHYPCPREATGDTVLVMTNRGIYLFCYGCSSFFEEGGRWGYKTSYAAFQSTKVDR